MDRVIFFFNDVHTLYDVLLYNFIYYTDISSFLLHETQGDMILPIRY